MIVPPKVEDDEAAVRLFLALELDERQRELCISGRLPLEQGVVFEQAVWDIAKDPTRHRQEGRCGGARLAAVGCRRARRTCPALQGKRRWPTTKPHHADRAPQRRRAARARRRWTDQRRPQSGSPATRGASTSSARVANLVHSRVGRCASSRRCVRCTSARATASTRFYRCSRARRPPYLGGRVRRSDASSTT